MRKLIESPEAHDGLVDRHPGMVPLPKYRQQPKCELTFLRDPEPPAEPEMLEEDRDEHHIGGFRENWTDIARRRYSDIAAHHRGYMHRAMTTMLLTLWAEHPEIMQRWDADRHDVERLSRTPYWSDIDLVELHMRRHPADRERLTEASCRKSGEVAHA